MASASAVAPLVSIEDYIARFVVGNEKPICEYEDGILIPKAMATKQHSQVQANLTTLIRNAYGERFNPLTELSTHVNTKMFYVADVAVEDLKKPILGRYPGPNEPVYLCAEIVSPPDRVGRSFGKSESYHRWGVPYCWVIDATRKIAWEYLPSDDEPRKVTDRLTAGEIELSLADVFFRV